VPQPGAYRVGLGRVFGPYALGEHVTAVKGDICQASWPEQDIEILFVDFTHHWRHHEAVVRIFYRHMVPGRSLLIHQDYVYTLCYWLHVFMEFCRDSFDLVSPPHPQRHRGLRLHPATAA
jgi:hypothetical protein